MVLISNFSITGSDFSNTFSSTTTFISVFTKETSKTSGADGICSINSICSDIIWSISSKISVGVNIFWSSSMGSNGDIITWRALISSTGTSNWTGASSNSISGVGNTFSIISGTDSFLAGKNSSKSVKSTSSSIYLESKSTSSLASWLGICISGSTMHAPIILSTIVLTISKLSSCSTGVSANGINLSKVYSSKSTVDPTAKFCGQISTFSLKLSTTAGASLSSESFICGWLVCAT